MQPNTFYEPLHSLYGCPENARPNWKIYITESALGRVLHDVCDKRSGRCIFDDFVKKYKSGGHSNIILHRLAKSIVNSGEMIARRSTFVEGTNTIALYTMIYRRLISPTNDRIVDESTSDLLAYKKDPKILVYFRDIGYSVIFGISQYNEHHIDLLEKLEFYEDIPQQYLDDDDYDPELLGEDDFKYYLAMITAITHPINIDPGNKTGMQRKGDEATPYTVIDDADIAQFCPNLTKNSSLSKAAITESLVLSRLTEKKIILYALFDNTKLAELNEQYNDIIVVDKMFVRPIDEQYELQALLINDEKDRSFTIHTLYLYDKNKKLMHEVYPMVV